jgi:hypothetical protein
VSYSFDQAAKSAPKIPDLTCQHIDGVLDQLSDAMGTLDHIDGLDEARVAWNILADLRDDEGPLERLRTMNDQLRRAAAYWKKIARQQADRIAELEQPASDVNWTHVNR